MEVAGHYFIGQYHKVPGCGNPSGAWAIAGSLVGGVRILKILRLGPACTGGDERSWGCFWPTVGQKQVWMQDPGIPEFVSDHWCMGLVSDTDGCGVLGVLMLGLAQCLSGAGFWVAG